MTAFSQTALLTAALALALSGSALAAHRHHPKPAAGATPPAPAAAAHPAGAAIGSIPFGAYCFTPLGRVGPGPVAPIGSPCTGTSGRQAVSGQTVN